MWSNRFMYDENSPSGLVWATDRYAGSGYKIKIASAGDSCGTLNRDGYYRVCIGGGKYRKSHLIVWEIFNGVRPNGMVVDHIDRDKTNNKISNLRLIDRNLSARNKGIPKNNKSGYTGVKINIKKSKTGEIKYWLASYNDLSGKRVCKHFNIDRLGSDVAFRLACEWRDLRIKALNEKGAGYTDTHGK